MKFETANSNILYGLENSVNWGWDWFATADEARQAAKTYPNVYGHNTGIRRKSRARIEADNE